MTPREIALVQTSFDSLRPESAAALLYRRLFDLDPSIATLFAVDMGEQGRRLLAMIGLAVRGLGDVEVMLPALRDLGLRHVDYGIRPEHYATLGAALLWTLDRDLGAAFTEEVRDAWTEVYRILSTAMIEAARNMAA